MFDFIAVAHSFMMEIRSGDLMGSSDKYEAFWVLAIYGDFITNLTNIYNISNRTNIVLNLISDRDYWHRANQALKEKEEALGGRDYLDVDDELLGLALCLGIGSPTKRDLQQFYNMPVELVHEHILMRDEIMPLREGNIKQTKSWSFDWRTRRDPR